MAAVACSSVARGKILLKAQEVTFAKALAGNNLVFRDRAVRRLKKWFEARSKGKFCFEEDDLMRVWKGLYHCMWMSDKPLVQEALSEEIAALIHSFATPEQMTLFIRCFYLTMINEWIGIDQLRLDKYLMLIRRVLRQSLVALSRLEWEQSVLELYNTTTESTVLTQRELVPIGLVTHYCSIFLEELAKIGGSKLAGPVVSQLLPPFVGLWAESRSLEVRKMVMRSVLDPLIAQSPITLREDARFRAWAKAGFPGTSMYSMEIVEDKEEELAEGEEPEDEAEVFDGLDPRAGSADVVLEPITFDAGLVAKLFNKHLVGKVGRVHVSISRQQLKFARLAKGLDPLTKRHRVQHLRDLPLMRKHAQWRCARQWESAVALSEFDSAKWKAAKTRKNKFKGETEDEIFADFVSKHSTKKKSGASGEFTVEDHDLANGSLANGDSDGEAVAEGHSSRSKKKKLSGEWTVTTENGHEDAAAPSQKTPKQTPSGKLGKRKARQMDDEQSTLDDSSNKQPPVKSAKKQSPLVESDNKNMSHKEQKLSEESTKEQAPSIETAKKKSAVESKKQAPLAGSPKKQTPIPEAAVEASVPSLTTPRGPEGGLRKLFSPNANQQLMSSTPVERDEPRSPAERRKLPSAEKAIVGSVGAKVRNAFSAALETYKNTPQAKASPSPAKAVDSVGCVTPLGKAKEIQKQPPKPATNGTTATVAKVLEADSPVSAGHRLCLNVIPGKVAAVTQTKKRSVVPGSPSRTSLRIAQKAPLDKTVTTPKRPVPNAVEVLRSARASLGSPGGTKRVNIALSRNEAQEVWEYHAALESSPGIPFDAARRPAESALKPGAVPSPVNPFYRRPRFLS